MNWYYHYKVGLNIKYFWTQISKLIPSLILPTIGGTLMLYFINLQDIKYFISCVFLFLIISCLSYWFISFNAYEKELILKPYLKLKTKFVKK